MSKRVLRTARRLAGVFAAVCAAGLVLVPSALAAFGFGAATNFATGSTPASVAVGDLNGDAKPDLAVVNLNSDTVSVLLGDGAGSFGAATHFATDNGPTSVALGDLAAPYSGGGKP